MKTIWAPWRLEFILDPKAKTKAKGQSVFAALLKQKPSYNNLILHKSKTAFILLNKFPYSNGHMMVIPKRQVADLDQLTPDEHCEIGALLALSVRVLKKSLKPEGFNVGLNLGKAAGAGIVNHIHYHVVPRWVGDTNFMPIFAETKVLPEHLKATYLKLKKSFDAS